MEIIWGASVHLGILQFCAFWMRMFHDWLMNLSIKVTEAHPFIVLHEKRAAVVFFPILMVKQCLHLQEVQEHKKVCSNWVYFAFI